MSRPTPLPRVLLFSVMAVALSVLAYAETRPRPMFHTGGGLFAALMSR